MDPEWPKADSEVDGTAAEGAVEPLQGATRYSKIRDLNLGTYGPVQLAQDKQTGELVVCKLIPRGNKVTEYLESAILNHRRLVHPHIVQFKEVFLAQQYLGIAMEFASGGDMFQYVVKKNGLREEEARWCFQQLIVGLDYCHRMGVVHRDIKLENTLLDSSPRPLVKICTFCRSKDEKSQTAPERLVGTPAYLAPEVILTTRGKTYDGKMADIWSCGVMLYVMLVGAFPFERPEDKTDSQKLQKMIQRIITVDYNIPSYIQLSPEGHDLLRRMLVADPAARITVAQIYDHPWYCKNLPPGVKEMNDRPQPLPEGLQSAEEVSRILQEARHPGTSASAGVRRTDSYDLFTPFLDLLMDI